MARKQWPLEVHGVEELLDTGLEVHEMTARDLLVEILSELKKLNMHMYTITDEEIEENDT